MGSTVYLLELQRSLLCSYLPPRSGDAKKLLKCERPICPVSFGFGKSVVSIAKVCSAVSAVNMFIIVPLSRFQITCVVMNFGSQAFIFLPRQVFLMRLILPIFLKQIFDCYLLHKKFLNGCFSFNLSFHIIYLCKNLQIRYLI